MTFVHFINVLSGFYGIAGSFSIAIIVSCGQLTNWYPPSPGMSIAELAVITCRTELFTCTTEAGSRSAATSIPPHTPGLCMLFWVLLGGFRCVPGIRHGIHHPYVALVDKDHQEVDRGRCLCSAVELFTKSPEGPRQLLISARRLGAGTQPSRLSGAPNDSRRNPKRCVHQRSRDRPPAAEALRDLPSPEKRPAESESWRTCRVWGTILIFGKLTSTVSKLLFRQLKGPPL